MKQPARRKYLLGLTLVIIALVSAVIAPVQMIRSWLADFSCDHDMYPEVLAGSNVRLAYCIDYIGRYVFSGAGIYARDSSEQETLTVEGIYEEGFEVIVLERQGQTLKVNGQGLPIDQSFARISWSPSLNPWLLYANHLKIRNAGVDSKFGTLLVKGEVRESWLLNPTGLILLIAGVMLVVRNKREVTA